jgi:beta-N-acetylhexosaminidase
MKVAVAGVALAALVIAGCSSSKSADPITPLTSWNAPSSAPAHVSPRPTPTMSTPRPPKPSPSQPSNPKPTTSAQQILQRMSEAQRVGQLFMVGAASGGPDSDTTSAITTYHVGSVILTDTSSRSVDQIAGVSRQLQQEAPRGTQLFVATDQEGGQVQRLQGPGFDTIPDGLAQGKMSPRQLRTNAKHWGSQLHEAGVNLDLAPVVDTVPDGASNPPIGDLDRQFGDNPSVVASHGIAFAQGMADAGVDATIKHFPGLGRVTGNTDTTAGVTDRVTSRHDAYLAPFAAGVQAGVPFVMVSTAIYSRIDPDHPAAFSPTVVTGMLRGDLHFKGVIISDDMGGAAQVAAFSPAARAVNFIAAGGDVVLTVNAVQIPEMTAAVLARAKTDSTFRAEVDAAALRVLIAKQARGLL